MPSGGRRKGAGRKPLPAAIHLQRGTWRESRHGPRPSTAAVVLEMPVPAGQWAPRAADVAALGAAGRPLVEWLTSHYDFAPVEGVVLIEAGHAADALAAVRAAEQPDMVSQKLEMQWSKHYAALLGQLHLESMRLKVTTATPDPRHVKWLSKWGDSGADFTQTMFRESAFASVEDARRAWPAVRSAVWREMHRFSVPRAAQRFDGITIDGVDAVRWSWNHVHFPLADCLAALAADRAHLDAFVAADPAGATSISGIITELRADFATIEVAARALAAHPGPHYLRPYPHDLSSGAFYGRGLTGGGA